MYRTTAGLVVVFLLLAGVAFAVEKTQPAPAAPDATVYALDIKEPDIQRIDVATAAGTIAFDRAEPFGWKFASGEAADLSRVSSVVNRLARLRSSAKVTDQLPGDLSPYGLAPATTTATLTLKDGSSKRVLIGGKTANDSAYYVLVEGATTMHTVNTLLVGDIEKLITEPPTPSPTPLPAGAAGATPTPGGSGDTAPTPGLPVPSTQ